MTLAWTDTRISVVDPDTYARLLRSRDFLADRFAERIPLAEAARLAHLSPYHFHRLFSRVFQETPHEFLRRRRLEKAKTLLVADHQSVTGVCLEVGYESLGSFSTLFRSRFGCSPAEFRRELRRIYRIPYAPSHRFIPTCLLLRMGVRWPR